MTALTGLFTSDIGRAPMATVQALEAKAAATSGAAPGRAARWLSGFMNMLGGSSAASLVPGGTANDHFTFLRNNFGNLDAPMMGGELGANEAHFQHAINQHGMNIPFDPAQVQTLNDARRNQQQLITNMERTLEDARLVAARSVPDMMRAVQAEAAGIRTAFEGIITGAGTAANHADLNAVRALMGGDAQHQALVRQVAGRSPTTGATVQFVEVHFPGSRSPIRIGQLGAVAAGGHIDVVAARQAQIMFDQIGTQVTANMSGYLETVNTSVNAIRNEINKAKGTFDRLGAAMGHPPAYAPPPTPAATPPAGAATPPVPTEEATKDLMKLADGKTMATSLEGHHIKSNTMGVVGKEEAGIWSKIKANIMVSENKLVTHAGTGQQVVEATARGTPGMIFRGGTLVASLGAVALGLKGMVQGKTDENGMSVASDSGDWMKNTALVVGGAAAFALLGLKGSKAMGHVPTP